MRCAHGSGHFPPTRPEQIAQMSAAVLGKAAFRSTRASFTDRHGYPILSRASKQAARAIYNLEGLNLGLNETAEFGFMVGTQDYGK